MYYFDVAISLDLGDRLNATQNQAEGRIGHTLVQSFCVVVMPFDAEATQQHPYCSTLKLIENIQNAIHRKIALFNQIPQKVS